MCVYIYKCININLLGPTLKFIPLSKVCHTTTQKKKKCFFKLLETMIHLNEDISQTQECKDFKQ